jgi:hypothetical protein
MQTISVRVQTVNARLTMLSPQRLNQLIQLARGGEQIVERRRVAEAGCVEGLDAVAVGAGAADAARSFNLLCRKSVREGLDGG